MEVEFKFEGGKELEKALRALPIRLEKTAVKEALGKGARVLAAEAKRRAPIESGTLKRSIQVVRRRQAGLVTVATRSGKKYQARRMDAWYASLVEFGSRHAPARPFLRPALDARKAEIIRMFGTTLAQAIARFARGYATATQERKANR